MMLKIQLFGSTNLIQNGADLNLRRRKAIAMLVYLAVTRQPIAREALTTLFWPDFDQAAARMNLRRDLSWLRQSLQADLLLVDRYQVAFNQEAEVQLDVYQFEVALASVQAHAHPPETLCTECAQILAEAIEWIGGEFMAGFSLADCAEFDEWLFFQREHWRRETAGALERLVNWYIDQKSFQQGIDYGRRWLSLDPWHEPAHRMLMKLYAWSDQQAAALRQYETCRRLLEGELGVEPEAETIALAEAIRSRQFGPGRWEIEGTAAPVPLVIPPAALPPTFPAHTTPFIGREKELAQLMALISDPAGRLVTVVAPGGMGKTRLAIAAAAALAPNLAHGVCFVALAPLNSPENIVPAITTALQLPARGGDPKAQLLKYLQDKQLLLVLDNFEHLLANPETGMVGGQGLVSDMLQAGAQVKVLATSRERLNLSGENLLVLEGLAVQIEETAGHSSAAQLFQHHLQLIKPSLDIKETDRATIDRICRLVAGMPLALILAASWIDMLSLDEIAEEITRSLDFLETDMVDMPERQRSIRAVFDAVWQRLDADAQDIFRKLSVFRGGFSRRAAETVSGAGLRTLRTLVHKLFVTVEETGRYQIHELLRQYGAEKLVATDDATAIRRAHAAYYAGWLHENEKEITSNAQEMVLAQIMSEVSNIQAAWHFGVQRRDVTIINQALAWVCELYRRQGWLEQGQALLLEAIAAFQSIPEPDANEVALMVKLNTWLARFYSGLGRYDEAAVIFQHSLEVAQRRGDIAESAFLLGQLGLIADWKHEHMAALELTRQSLDLYQSIHDEWGLAIINGQLGSIYLSLGDFDAADTQLQAALTIFRRRQEKKPVAQLLNNLGCLAIERGEIAAGKAYLEESLELKRSFGERMQVCSTLINLGISTNLNGDPVQAEAYLQEAVTLAREVGIIVYEMGAYETLAFTAFCSGQDETAQSYCDGVLRMLATVEHKYIEAALNITLGLLAGRRGNRPEAGTHFAHSLALSRAMDTPLGEARALGYLAAAQQAMGEHAAARSSLLEGLLIAIRLQAGIEIIKLLAVSAPYLVEDGHVALAMAVAETVIYFPYIVPETKEPMAALMRDQQGATVPAGPIFAKPFAITNLLKLAGEVLVMFSSG